MPNDWFQFKQFKIHQDLCAMKVSTDACIQGAWAVEQLKLLKDKPASVLDIGTGTGLLTLMMAQDLPAAHFDALEINEDAYRQAIANFEDSAWGLQIQAIHSSLELFVLQPSGRYNFIICNPPFFQNHLESATKARNDARHSQSLSKDTLAESVVDLLEDTGKFCVMFPTSEWEMWLKVASKNGLFLESSLSVKPKETHAANRTIGIFTKQKVTDPIASELIIYTAEKQYSDAMQHLLKDYYLAF